ncbi:MAG: 50S ribosomal protein L17 [Verrucomicrobia bacterium]|nr:50S ribosomal protein L17 [Verrucomicrobiota bacterium]
MRHRNKTLKLGRKTQHRHLMLANLVCSLIQRGRVRTTVEKARAARPLAEKMVTLAKKGTIHHRRLAISRLRQETAVRKLFTDVAPRCAARNGGYTRIIRLGQRIGDAASTAYIEWVDQAVLMEKADDATAKKSEAKPAEKPA